VGPASVINMSCEYSNTIGPKETNALTPKYTKIKTASCGAQLRGFKSVLGWAIHQPRISGASIPYHEVAKKTEKGKSGPQKCHFRRKWTKIDQKMKIRAREINRISAASTSETACSPPHPSRLYSSECTENEPKMIAQNTATSSSATHALNLATNPASLMCSYTEISSPRAEGASPPPVRCSEAKKAVKLGDLQLNAQSCSRVVGLAVECSLLQLHRQPLRRCLTLLGHFLKHFENCPHRFAGEDDVSLKSAVLSQSNARHDEGIGIAHRFMAIG
jgi:hypothetical protein